MEFDPVFIFCSACLLYAMLEEICKEIENYF